MVTRADLTPAQQAVQAGHAALLYAHEHPGDWHDGYLVVLAVPGEYDLHDLAFRLLYAGCDESEFWEAGLSELTAIAAAGPIAGRMLQRVPLALSTERG